jgi:NurA-like 5'-3' nuclease
LIRLGWRDLLSMLDAFREEVVEDLTADSMLELKSDGVKVEQETLDDGDSSYRSE